LSAARRRDRSPLITAAAWLTAAAVIVVRAGDPADGALADAALPLPPVIVLAPSSADSLDLTAPVTTTVSTGTVAVVTDPTRPAPPKPAATRKPAPRPRTAGVRPFARKPLATSPADSATRSRRFLATRLLSPRILAPRLPALKGLLGRATPGQPVQVTLTAYCLKGTTRRGLPVREGIVAADPRVFPLARHVEIHSDGRFLGRFLVDDTGGVVKGPIIDIWTPSCDDARKFGRRVGTASLVAVGTD
jgi:3D (Asp-Asp-Asp) domain-containing protein